jgi:hypothetical protein
MMNNEQYKSELDGVKASDAFKQSTIALLLRARQDADGEQLRARTEPKRKIFTSGRIVALAATLVLLVGGFMVLHSAFVPAGGASPMAEQATGAASMAAAESTPGVDTGDFAEAEDAKSARAPKADNVTDAVTGQEDGADTAGVEEPVQAPIMPNAPVPMMTQELPPNRLPLIIIGVVCVLAAFVIGIVPACKKALRKQK